MKKIAMLTGGGDCPGLNAVIRAVTRKGLLEGYEVLGFRNGWAGVLKGDYFPLTRERVSGILHLGGTILGTSRTNPTGIGGYAFLSTASRARESRPPCNAECWNRHPGTATGRSGGDSRRGCQSGALRPVVPRM